jgi:acetyl-CoA carboxylase biotin carboxyl carrier protein
MKFETDYIEKLAKVLAETGLTEISLEDGEQAITLRREVVVSAPQVVAAPVQAAPAAAPAPVASAPAADVAPAKKCTPITSPMVGTFYSAPSPDAPAFVKVGDNVSAGQVVCIIEAMKLMNEIEAEVSGKITEICVKNGDAIEFGQVLMYVE